MDYNRFWQEYFDWLKLKGAGVLWKIVEGKTDKGVYDILKTAPFIGPFNQFNRFIAELFK